MQRASEIRVAGETQRARVKLHLKISNILRFNSALLDSHVSHLDLLNKGSLLDQSDVAQIQLTPEFGHTHFDTPPSARSPSPSGGVLTPLLPIRQPPGHLTRISRVRDNSANNGRSSSMYIPWRRFCRVIGPLVNIILIFFFPRDQTNEAVPT